MVTPPAPARRKVQTAQTAATAPAHRHDHTRFLICSMPKLVPFVLRLNGTSNIDIASQGWSHLITKCGTRVYARVAGEGIRLRRHSKWREEIDIEPNYLRGVVRMPSLNGEGEEKKVVKPLPL